MKNSDLKRFYKGAGIDPKDFVRLGQDGKIPGDLLPETGPTILELSDVSGTLTDEQYELATGDNCVISLGTQRYYKMYDAATLIVYQTATRQAGQDSALYEYIEITKSTKVWEYKEENIVEGNPTLEGTEAELTGIEIGKTKYKVSNVAANPTLAGTEAELTGIEVDGVKYKAGGGGELYKHNIQMNYSKGSYTAQVKLFCLLSSATPITKQTSALEYAVLWIYGTFKDPAVSATENVPIYHLYTNSVGSHIFITKTNSSENIVVDLSAVGSFSDTVTQIL